MPGKKNNVPMTRIQERAPEHKWMGDARLPPDSVQRSPQKAILSKQQAQQREMQNRLSQAPDVFDGYDAQAHERRAAQDKEEFLTHEAENNTRIEALEEEAAELRDTLTVTEKTLMEATDNTENLKQQKAKLQGDLHNALANEKRATKQLKQEKAAREADATKLQQLEESAMALEKAVEAADKRVKELESQEGGEVEEVEVEIYPPKILVSEIANVIRKNQTIILKTQVQMDDELVAMAIRMPFKKLKAAIDKVDRTSEEEEE